MMMVENFVDVFAANLLAQLIAAFIIIYWFQKKKRRK